MLGYKCLNCGHLFEKGEEAIWVLPNGSKTATCPLCHGNFAKTQPCKICTAEHLPDELVGGVCMDCIKKHYHDMDICLKIGAMEKEEIELNSYLASTFTVKQIEDILICFIKKNKMIDVSCETFAYDNLSWFGEKLKEML